MGDGKGLETRMIQDAASLLQVERACPVGGHGHPKSHAIRCGNPWRSWQPGRWAIGVFSMGAILNVVVLG